MNNDGKDDRDFTSGDIDPSLMDVLESEVIPKRRRKGAHLSQQFYPIVPYQSRGKTVEDPSGDNDQRGRSTLKRELEKSEQRNKVLLRNNVRLMMALLSAIIFIVVGFLLCMIVENPGRQIESKHIVFFFTILSAILTGRLGYLDPKANQEEEEND